MFQPLSMVDQQDRKTLLLENEQGKSGIYFKEPSELTLRELIEPIAPEKARIPEKIQTYEKITNPKNIKISIRYCNEICDRNEIIIDNELALSVAHEIMNDDYEPRV